MAPTHISSVKYLIGQKWHEVGYIMDNQAQIVLLLNTWINMTQHNTLIKHIRISLQWRHNGHNGVSNHQPHHCLLNRLFKRRSKKTSKLRVTGLCEGNSPGTGEFPAQMASNAENVSIWWRHHVFSLNEEQINSCWHGYFQRKCEILRCRTLNETVLIKYNLCKSPDPVRNLYKFPMWWRSLAVCLMIYAYFCFIW